MTITEKKPLLIRIPGEITPNELPVSASAVGYDFVQGNYLIYSTGSDSWVTAPPNTAGIQEYWQSTVNNNIFTTGSINGSSTITATTGFSGSLTTLTDGSPYLIAGNNVSITTGSNGAVTVNAITSSNFFRLELLDYEALSSVTSTTLGQVIFPANEYTGSLTLRGVIYSNDATNTGSIQLYNVTSGAYVDIGGPGVKHLSVTGTIPTIIQSVNLISASGFSSSSQAIYELVASSSNALNTSFFGSFEIRPQGTFQLNGGSGGSGGSPGGSSGQIQYNDGGSFGGVTNLTWDGVTLNATGSFKGNLDGTASYATNAATASNGLLVNGNLNVNGGVVTYGGTTVDGGTIVGQQFEDTDTSGNSYGLVIKNSGTGNGVPFLSFVQGATLASGFAGGIGGWTKAPSSGYIPGLNLSFYSSYPRIGIRNAAASANIATFDANGLQVTGSVNVSNGVKVAAGGLQVAGIVPGISAPYNDTPVIIDLASGQQYGPVIRSVAGQYNFAALSLDQNGTYLGGIYGLENDPGGFGYVDGVNLYVNGANRKINFNVNSVSVGRFTSNGLQVTGSINGSSTITAATGFSGSLTKLTDGSDYLIAGTNIQLSTGSNGAITIAATSVFNLALNGSAPGVSTNIGGIYIPASTTVTTKSLAYIGGSTVSEVAVLKMVPINSVTVSASWVVTGTLTSVSLSNPVTLGPGWYDLTLETGTVSQTAFGRGLYLTSGDI